MPWRIRAPATAFLLTPKASAMRDIGTPSSESSRSRVTAGASQIIDVGQFVGRRGASCRYPSFRRGCPLPTLANVFIMDGVRYLLSDVAFQLVAKSYILIPLALRQSCSCIKLSQQIFDSIAMPGGEGSFQHELGDLFAFLCANGAIAPAEGSDNGCDGIAGLSIAIADFSQPIEQGLGGFLRRGWRIRAGLSVCSRLRPGHRPTPKFTPITPPLAACAPAAPQPPSRPLPRRR